MVELYVKSGTYLERKKENQDCESYNVKTDEKQRQSKRQKVAYS